MMSVAEIILILLVIAVAYNPEKKDEYISTTKKIISYFVGLKKSVEEPIKEMKSEIEEAMAGEENMINEDDKKAVC